MADTKDYYVILGIERDADTAAIETAGQRAEMKLHPDRVRRSVMKENANATAEEIQAAIDNAAKDLHLMREAVAVLKDPALRQAYNSGGVEAVARARNGETGAMSQPSTTKRIMTQFKPITNSEEADDFFDKYVKKTPASTSGSSASPATPATPAPSTGNSSRAARLANIRNGGAPQAEQPPVQQPAPVEKPVQQVQQPVHTPQPVQAPVENTANPLNDINNKAEQLKDAFGKVSVPLDSLLQIRDKLQEALDVVNQEISKAKPKAPGM